MAGPNLYRDPWAKRDAWRRHPVFARRQMFANMFPGFGIALVAFTCYVVADNFYGGILPQEQAKAVQAGKEHHH